MPRALTRSDTTTLSEFLEGVMLYPIGFVICSTTAPGFLLCIPAVTVMALVVVVPLVAVAVVVLSVAAVVATPVVLFRLARTGATRLAAALPRRQEARHRAPELERRPLAELAPR